MKKLPLLLGVFILFFLSSEPRVVWAVTIASQDQSFSDQLNVWQAIQELGTNLTGTLDKFTFRISTTRTNLNQFDHTAENTRFYDKSNNTYILGCMPPNSDPADRLRGLNFNSTNIPAGYEDVSIDFSCRNYSLVAGHKYLIKISNANMGNSGSGTILFAGVAYANKPNVDYFPNSGLRYGNGNVYDYVNNSGRCDPSVYNWGSTDPWHNGCYVWTSPKDDLYFNLTNNSPPPPPPRLPVVFIPGIGGSEFKASQDIFWTASDGHGGTYSHGYGNGEKIWVNQDEAAKLGDDDYFDVLRLKPDGQTPEANLSLSGNLTSFGYGDIDPFFAGMGYVKGTNFFVFNYDWRKDIRGNKDSLDSLIEQAKTSSGQAKVNLVVHSMGGLIARYYISDPNKAAKINKLIELGVPHLGATSAIKTLMYGFALQKNVFGIFPIGIPASEVRDISQNNPGLFQLLPSSQYFNFYNNSDKDHPYPFRDDRDIDNNNITGVLNYNQTKSLLSNLSYNMAVFGLGEQFHGLVDSTYNQTNGVKVYEIAGSSQPTLGQIHETWWISWPINLIPKTDQIFINGDDTVPLYSASLKNDSLDLSGAAKIYYVEQKHADLVSANGSAMQTVKSILNDDNSLPVEVKDQKIVLEGKQISMDDVNLDLYDESNNHTGINSSGDVETKIPNTFYDSLGKTKHIFVKKSAQKLTVKITSPKTTTVKIKIRNYSQDSINKTILYNDIPLTSTSSAQFTVDPAAITAPAVTAGTLTFSKTAEATGSAALDQTPPATTIQVTGVKDDSGIYTGAITISLTGNDNASGILKTEYSLNNGQSVQTYTNPFTISTPGKTTLQVKSIDNLGNEEIPQSIVTEIAPAPAPTPTPKPTLIATGSAQLEATSSATPSAALSPAPSPPATPTTTTYTNPTAERGSSGSTNSPTPVPSPISIPVENPIVIANSFSSPSPDTSPSELSSQDNDKAVLGVTFPALPSKKTKNPAEEILVGLLIISGGIVVLAFLGLALTFLKPFPGKMN